MMSQLWKGTVTVLRATERALFVDFGGREPVWIPLSQIHDDSTIYRSNQIGESDELVIPEWLAIEKGMA
jgi:hypothetical protein